MFNSRNTRRLRRRCHLALVWAMVPLAVLNGRTVVGCGCSGRVLAECHCGQAMPGTDARSRHEAAKCPKCVAAKRVPTSPCCSAQRTAATHDSAPSFGGHHCRSVADYQVVPATSVLPAVDEHVASLDIAAASPAIVDEVRSTWRELPFSIAPHPPNDLVVVLHRLVI